MLEFVWSRLQLQTTRRRVRPLHLPREHRRDRLFARYLYLFKDRSNLAAILHQLQIFNVYCTGWTNISNKCRTPEMPCPCVNGDCMYDRTGVKACICIEGFSGVICNQIDHSLISAQLNKHSKDFSVKKTSN